jgi:cyclopropane fatty-acyl-phospholipid synthase-like methyltransferase
MGFNPLWLAEWICQSVKLKQGMRILDMGCGKALSSIFLAKEFGVKVVANDLWVDPSENWIRIKECKLENEIIPIKAEAHSLPYADNYFDGAICIENYQYYGYENYAGYFSKFIKPGGFIAIAQNGHTTSKKLLDINAIPEYFIKYFTGQLDQNSTEIDTNDYTVQSWKERLEKGNKIKVMSTEILADGSAKYIKFLEELEKAGYKYRLQSALEDNIKDNGKFLCWMKLIGKVIH